MKLPLRLIVVLLLLPAAQLQAQQDDVLDEVLVTGEQPGPAMWKVSQGDHTLWIVGSLTPLPGKMTWRSKQVESVIGRSGEVLGGYSVDGKIKGGKFAALRLIPSVMRLRHNADGATLREALPPEVHARWHALHVRYFGHAPDADDRTRPMYAADLLYQQALKRSGLSMENVVTSTVQKLAKRHKVKIRERKFDVMFDDPKGMIADIAAISREREVQCLVATLDRIDNDVPNMKRRAQAWAVGDIATLRALPYVNQQRTCLQAIMDRPKLRTLIEAQEAKMRADRPGIVAYMLLAHETSFTTLPLEELLKPDGELARFRAAGYTVEEPQ